MSVLLYLLLNISTSKREHLLLNIGGQNGEKEEVLQLGILEDMMLIVKKDGTTRFSLVINVEQQVALLNNW